MEAMQELLPDNPAIQFVLLLVAAVWSSNALSKAKIAEKFGALSWIPDGIRRISRRTAERELSERQELAELRDYAIYVARHNFLLEEYAAERGWELPEPPLMTLTEWRESRRNK